MYALEAGPPKLRDSKIEPTNKQYHKWFFYDLFDQYRANSSVVRIWVLLWSHHLQPSLLLVLECTNSLVIMNLHSYSKQTTHQSPLSNFLTWWSLRVLSSVHTKRKWTNPPSTWHQMERFTTLTQRNECILTIIKVDILLPATKLRFRGWNPQLIH